MCPERSHAATLSPVASTMPTLAPTPELPSVAGLSGTAQRPVQEMREEERIPVDRPPLGHIVLKARGSMQLVHVIRDISAHGVSLVLDEEVAPGEPVLLAQTLPHEHSATAGDGAAHPPTHAAALAQAHVSTHAASHAPAPHAPGHGTGGLDARLAADPALTADHVYRAYVVWCRRQAADDHQPGLHYVAGLRVFDPHGLDHLVAQPSTD
ncbi:MAG: hypothetical protein RIQ60_2103 [Pseudomonadota bacterium]|jgi:hypothetical protein